MIESSAVALPNNGLEESEYGSSTRARFAQIARSHWTVLTLILLMLVIPFSAALDHPASAMDEGFLLVYPEMILKGKLPYKDFETFYGPANPFLLSGVYFVAGATLFAERCVGLIYRLLVVAAMFAIGRRWNTSVASGCALVTGLLLVPTFLPAYAWFGAMACAIWSFVVAAQRSRALLGGILAGLALLFRPDIGPALVLAALPFVLKMAMRERWRYAGGGVLALLPLAGILFLVGGTNLIDNLFAYPVFHCSAGRRLPLSIADTFVLNIFVAHLAACTINLAAGLIALRSRKRAPGSALLLALALFGTGLTCQAMQRLDSIHVLFAAFVSIGMLPLSAFVIASTLRSAARSPAIAWLCTAATLAVFEALAPELVAAVRNDIIALVTVKPNRAVFLPNGDRSYALGSIPYARTVARMLDKVEGAIQPGQRLFVGPSDLRRTNYCDTWLYHMLPKLEPATYFLEMNPFSANRAGSRLASDVRSADWLILNDAWNSADEPNHSRDYGPDEPNQIVRQNFEVVGTFGSFHLYRRRT